MREILFRGKTKGDVWVYGSLVVNTYSTAIVGFMGIYYDVLLETGGQYTGLLDKNGTKIFEGDCLGHRLNVVEFSYGGWNVNGDRPLGWLCDKYEVIGNIHDGGDNV